ncbi:putative C2 calcium-dependent membrane targeting [Cocos nucifera]|uniref:Putative C2 calcium-dependent membrane targeting n=1 Tax=Cocos nucifera TaxID=13894 RepID=A0A8K0IT63_COCNU|nr:putative C2 calcium-dependent membrane targeting [Cocos nucifera]
MSQSHDPPHLKYELKVVRLANFDPDLPGSLFVRYYIFAGNGRRIRIDTREIKSTSNPCWNELASVECWGALDTIAELLEHQSIVFELRWRRTTPILGRFTGSKLLGRGKLAWKDVLATCDVSLERWVSFVTTSRASNGLKSPTLFIEMKVNVMNVRYKGRVGRLMSYWRDCGCKHCDWIGSEEDMFQAATIVDGW